MDKYKMEHRVEKMAKVFNVSRSGYYSWKNRPESERSMRNKELMIEIKKIFNKSRQTYGYNRIYKGLQKDKIDCGINRVAKLMRENGIKAKAAKKYKATTDSNHKNTVSENILDRQFNVSQPNKAWASDITYIWTQEGWLYLCVIIDLFSRKIVGWSTSNRINRELVIKAFNMAVINRQPGKDLIFHSDRGVQYTSKDFLLKLKEKEFISSMSRRGNCWDNACAESFFHTLKIEEVKHKIYFTRHEAHLSLFEYIEIFYNRYRMHSFLNYLSPEEFERQKTA
jgi:putative transposase